MMKTIAVILCCLFFTVGFSGCLQQGIQVEADAQRKDPDPSGLLPAVYQFNISNLVNQDITNIDVDIVFFKINEHELSKYLVNTRFYGEKTTLAPGETNIYYCETYLDPQLPPLNISRIWGTKVHWQMTFKISWEAKKIYTTTHTFNWEFPEE